MEGVATILPLRIERRSARKIFSELLQAHAWASSHGWPPASEIPVNRLFAEYHDRLADEMRARLIRRIRRVQANPNPATAHQAQGPIPREAPRADPRVVLHIGAGSPPTCGGAA